MIIRKAMKEDVRQIADIYEAIHTEEEKGRTTLGWIRGVYPTEKTALASFERDDLFVMEEDGQVLGAAIINQQQVDVYADGQWQDDPPAHEVMVLHTLVISPKHALMGYGRQFVRFYEEYAIENGCRYLRMDTNARNLRARAMYQKLGYREAGIVPCVFNGIPGVGLVLLEKRL